MTQELFRKEAIRHRTRALFGDVILAAPKASWILTGVLAAVVLIAVIVGSFAEVDGQSLWRWALAS